MRRRYLNLLLYILASSLFGVVHARELHYRVPKLLTPRQLTNIIPPVRNTSILTPALLMFLGLAFSLGLYLIIISQRLWRFTIGASFGMTLAALSWIVIFNTIPSRSPIFELPGTTTNACGEQVIVRVTTPPFVSNSASSFYAETAAAIAAIVATLVGMSLGFTRLTRGKGRQAGMVLYTIFGGLSFSVSLLLVRPGFLFPIYALNWVFVGLSVVGSLLLLWRIPQAEMLTAPLSVGLFFIACGIDTAMNGAQGILVGVRILFTFNLVVPNTAYQPPISSLLTVGVAQIFVPIIVFLQYRFAPESWKVEWSWFCKDDNSYFLDMYSKSNPGSPALAAPKSRFSL